MGTRVQQTKISWKTESYKSAFPPTLLERRLRQMTHDRTRLNNFIMASPRFSSRHTVTPSSPERERVPAITKSKKNLRKMNALPSNATVVGVSIQVPYVFAFVLIAHLSSLWNHVVSLPGPMLGPSGWTGKGVEGVPPMPGCDPSSPVEFVLGILRTATTSASPPCPLRKGR